MGYEIKGLDALMKKLQSLGGNVQEALNTAVKRTTLKARADAQALCISGGGSQADSSGSGALRGSIHQRYETNADGSITGVVYSNSDHAVFVEFGTGPVGAANHGGISPNVHPSYTSRTKWVYPTRIKGKKTFRTTSGQPARPFMYPTSVLNRNVFLDQAVIVVLQAIKRAAKGGR